MTSTILITTKLKTNDAVAATAFQCLTSDMQSHQFLKKLSRWECWFVTFQGIENSSLDRFVQTLIQDTRVFVNPNKHSYHVYFNIEELLKNNRSKNGNYIFRCFISDIDDTVGENSRNTLHNLYDLSEQILKIEFGILWEIETEAANFEEALCAAKSICITESQEKGLLANPHSQKIKFLESSSEFFSESRI
jgi:hypothetical protein